LAVMLDAKPVIFTSLKVTRLISFRRNSHNTRRSLRLCLLPLLLVLATGVTPDRWTVAFVTL
jgi:hypothetical protein